MKPLLKKVDFHTSESLPHEQVLTNIDMKEQILKEFDEEYLEKIDKYNPLKEDLIKLFTDQKQFLIKAISQTREETIREVEKRIVKYIDENKKKNFNNREFIGYEILDLIN